MEMERTVAAVTAKKKSASVASCAEVVIVRLECGCQWKFFAERFHDACKSDATSKDIFCMNKMMTLSVLGRNDSKESVPLRSHQDRWGWLYGLFRPLQDFAQALAF